MLAESRSGNLALEQADLSGVPGLLEALNHSGSFPAACRVEAVRRLLRYLAACCEVVHCPDGRPRRQLGCRVPRAIRSGTLREPHTGSSAGLIR
jgi:hypothetical protein